MKQDHTQIPQGEAAALAADGVLGDSKPFFGGGNIPSINDIDDSDPRAMSRRGMLELLAHVGDSAQKVYNDGTKKHDALMVIAVLGSDVVLNAMKRDDVTEIPAEVREKIRKEPIINVQCFNVELDDSNGSKARTFHAWREFPAAARSGSMKVPKPFGLSQDDPIETLAALVCEAWAVQTPSMAEYEKVRAQMRENAILNGPNDTMESIEGRREVLMCNIIDADGLQLFGGWEIARDALGKVTLHSPFAKFSDAENFRMEGRATATGGADIH